MPNCSLLFRRWKMSGASLSLEARGFASHLFCRRALTQKSNAKPWQKASVHPYQATLDFAYFILEWTKCTWCYIEKKSFQNPNDSGRPLSYNYLPTKSKWLLVRSSAFLRFLYWTCWTESSRTVIQSPGFTNDYRFSISVNRY